MILTKIISKAKGEEFILDSNIPSFYLYRFLVIKMISCIYGMILFRRIRRCFVHPSSILKCKNKIYYGTNFSVGRECYIDALSEKGFVCGNNVSLGYHTHIELTGSLKHIGRGLIVGDNVGLGSYGYYGSGMGLLEIGSNTIIGNYVSFHPENHITTNLDVPIRLQGVDGKGIRIGENCWIGAKATILDGTTVGNGCIIAAGAVVRGCFPENVIIGGVPAKVLKHR